MKKRFLSLLCVFALVLTLLPTAVFAAEEEPAFSLEMEATVKSGHDMDELVEGDEVTVKVTAPKNAEMSSFQAHLNFDTDIFECTKTEYAGLGKKNTKTGWAEKLEATKEDANKNGYLSVSCAQYFDAKGNDANLKLARDTVIFSGVFKVKDGACEGLGNGAEESRAAEPPFALSDIDVAVVKNGKAVTVAVGAPKAIDAAVVRPEVTALTLLNEKGVAATKLSVVTGKSVEAYVQLTPANAKYGDFAYETPKGITFTFDDAQEEGRFPLTVTVAEDYNEDEAVVNITEPLSGKSVKCSLDIEVRATELTLDCDALQDDTLVLKKGGTATLKAVLSPSASKDKVTWTSDDITIATVVNGKVTAKGAGECKITATTEYGLEETCTVKVVEYISKMTIDQTKLTVPDDSEITLKVTVSPWRPGVEFDIQATVSGAGVTVTQANVTQADVDEDYVVDNDDGTATITYTVTLASDCAKSATVTFTDAYSKKSVKCSLSITQKAESITLDKETLSLQQGGTATLKATLMPSTSKEAVVWEVFTDEDCTTPSNRVTVVNGKITARKDNVGKCVVKATTASGGASDTCAVTVTPVLSSFALKDGTKSLSARNLVWNGEEEDQTFDLSDYTVFTWKDKTEQDGEYVDYETVEYDADGYEDIATVNENGVVTAVGPGKATVTVTAVDVNKSVKLTVNVEQAADCVTTTMSKDVFLITGKTTTLKATAAIKNDPKAKPTDTAVVWESFDETVATVDAKTGKVTAEGVGTCTITATPKTPAKGSVTPCEFNVTVVAGVITKLTVDQTKLTVPKGKSATVKVTVSPWGENYGLKIDTSGSDSGIEVTPVESVVPGENGVITYTVEIPADYSKTSAKVMFKDTCSGKSATCSVSTTNAATNVTLGGVKELVEGTQGKYSLPLQNGKTATLKATLDNSSKETVVWSVEDSDPLSGDEAVATVDANGKVTAKNPGTCTITVTTASSVKDDNPVAASCTVTVAEYITKMTIDQTALMLPKGKSATVKVTVSPWGTGYALNIPEIDVANVSVTPGTVTVTPGEVPPADVVDNGDGTATITYTVTATEELKKAASVTFTDTYSKKSVKCSVSTTNAATVLELAPTELSLQNGKTATLKAVLDKGCKETVVWSVENSDPLSGSGAVVTVDQKGKVTAVGNGTCVVKATTPSGLEATCAVTVNEFITKMTIDQTALTVPKGSSVPLKVTVSPWREGVEFDIQAAVSGVGVSVTQANVTQADVDEDYVVDNHDGTATITYTVALDSSFAKAASVTFKDGLSGKSVKCSLSVAAAAADSLTLGGGKELDADTKTLSLQNGKTATLKAVLDKGCKETVVWEAFADADCNSPTELITVDQKGKVTAAKNVTGTCVVKVTTVSTLGGEDEVTAMCTVYVTPVLKKVTVTATPGDLTVMASSSDLIVLDDCIDIGWEPDEAEEDTYEVTYSTTAKETVGKLNGDTFTAAKNITKKTTAKVTVTVTCGTQKKTCSLTITVIPYIPNSMRLQGMTLPDGEELLTEEVTEALEPETEVVEETTETETEAVEEVTEATGEVTEPEAVGEVTEATEEVTEATEEVTEVTGEVTEEVTEVEETEEVIE